jgi:16S rRNA (adenine1518-N6/adenine1519-N6)-dimethyltransferase
VLQPADNSIEIGPGQGVITTELLLLAGQMHAIDLDRGLVGPLAQRCPVWVSFRFTARVP